MSKKYTEEELEYLSNLVAQHQKIVGGALVMQLTHFNAYSNTVYTEILNPEVSKRKYLVTTTIEPLTEELKEKIMAKK